MSMTSSAPPRRAEEGPAAPSPAPRRPSRLLNMRVREAIAGYLFILPNLLGFLAFVSIPIVASLYFAFTDYNVLTPPKWVGVRNFKELIWFHHEDVPVTATTVAADGTAVVGPVFRTVTLPDGSTREEVVTERRLKANDGNFWYYCWNTVYLMLGLPLGMAASLFMALVMNQKIRGITFWRTLFFLPSITAGVAVYILWSRIYAPNGLLNEFLNAVLGWLGLFPESRDDWPQWLGSVTLAKPSLIIMGLWIGAGGFNMILYLAALQGVDPQLYEAAVMDGASNWQKFKHITWPLISPTTFFIFVMGVIGGFQGGFMQAYVMTEGGPESSTTTLAYYIFNNAFAWFRMGNAAAVAWFLFAVVFALTLVNWRYGGKHVVY